MNSLRPYPIEDWQVTYDFIGWNVTARNCPVSISLTEEQAFWVIGMIKRATAICAMPNNLRRLDAKWHNQS